MDGMLLVKRDASTYVYDFVKRRLIDVRPVEIRNNNGCARRLQSRNYNIYMLNVVEQKSHRSTTLIFIESKDRPYDERNKLNQMFVQFLFNSI